MSSVSIQFTDPYLGSFYQASRTCDPISNTPFFLLVKPFSLNATNHAQVIFSGPLLVCGIIGSSIVVLILLASVAIFVPHVLPFVEYLYK